MMSETSQVAHWEGSVSSPRPANHGQVLKKNDTFVVFNGRGEIENQTAHERGLYHLGTRYLSLWKVDIDDRDLVFLNAQIDHDNRQLVAEFTAPEIRAVDEHEISKFTLYVSRTLCVRSAELLENLELTNLGMQPVELIVACRYAGDFVDLFEIRGTPTRERQLLPFEQTSNTVTLGAQGLDGVRRQTCVHFDQPPILMDSRKAQFRVTLPPGHRWQLEISARCLGCGPIFGSSPGDSRDGIDDCDDWEQTTVESSNVSFNRWVARSLADLQMLRSKTTDGCYLEAGIPWFVTPFGRDALIAALQCCWIKPSIARGVLQFLAAKQADALDPQNEAAPGKIMHEFREGELAAMGAVPYQRYYGTIDATPLFIMLAGHYARRTHDQEFLRSIWPNILRAMNWIDTYGDPDGDGFIEYQKQGDQGLDQQGWKDSGDSIFHADGTLAQPPIALCEVQGYVVDAKRTAADIADWLKLEADTTTWRRQANTLSDQINERFWLEDLGTYALALDGDKQPCRVRTSNPGHLLFCGIPDTERAGTLARSLLAEDMFSGWGVRTVNHAERRFNPLSYHNGSIWPHDNSIIAAGLARYGQFSEALTIFTGLFDASQFLSLARLPELFCGFRRRPECPPTLYAMACWPQAWAAGSVFLMLQASLGLQFDLESPLPQFQNVCLPEWLQRVTLRNLRVGDDHQTITLERRKSDVRVTIDSKSSVADG